MSAHEQTKCAGISAVYCATAWSVALGAMPTHEWTPKYSEGRAPKGTPCLKCYWVGFYQDHPDRRARVHERITRSQHDSV